ncbi:MAG: hypothetical protein EP329_07190 [Deltaproteobacteria bacterium]|nr:MAG: hypothetical protein EP329_07190 [Deltaproteobacteria bacterium]
MTRLRRLGPLLAVVLAAGCAEASEVAGLPLGAACGPLEACAEGLLCVDALCVARPWPPDAASLEDTVTPIDLGVAPEDTVLADVPEDDVGPVDVDADAGDADADADAGSFTRVLVGEHTASEAPSDDAVTLQVDQAAVAELVSPAAGRLATLEVLAIEPPGGTSCGVFHVVYWLPDEGGAWPVEPAWYGPALALVGSDLTQEILVAEGPEVPVGPFRVGLIFTAACPDTPHQPRIVIDDSGVVAGTWLWARVGASATFVSGETLSLSGRWAMRAGIDVPSE